MSATPSAGHFRILYFSSASSFTKKPTEEFPAPLPITDLFDFLDVKYPGINQQVLRSCTVTLNEEYVDVSERDRSGRNVVIRDGDEVAVIPPISSG